MAKGLLSFLKSAPDESLEWFLEDKIILKRYVGQNAFLYCQIYRKLIEVLSVVFDGCDYLCVTSDVNFSVNLRIFTYMWRSLIDYVGTYFKQHLDVFYPITPKPALAYTL